MLSPIIAIAAGYYWYLAAASGTASIAMTAGLGALTILAGLSAIGLAINAARSESLRFQNLPPTEFAAIQQGSAIADAGESIVHTNKLAELGGMADTKKLERKMDDVVNAVKSLNLTTTITNKDLNVILTKSLT